MALTDRQIKAMQPEDKPRRYHDAGSVPGLYIEVSPSGGKWWRFRFSLNGKQRLMSLGVYPEVSPEGSPIGRAGSPAARGGRQGPGAGEGRCAVGRGLSFRAGGGWGMACRAGRISPNLSGALTLRRIFQFIDTLGFGDTSLLTPA